MLLRSLIGIDMRSHPGYVSRRRMSTDYQALNASIRFQFHPYHLNYGQVRGVDQVTFEVDALDGLVDPACNYVVVVSPWAHFPQWTKVSYMERTRLLREAVLRLRLRCPHVPVVLKGPHPTTTVAFSNNIFASDYIIKQIEVINSQTFKGIGVWFLPLWDLNLAHYHKNEVHMPDEVIRQELKMFLGFVCE